MTPGQQRRATRRERERIYRDWCRDVLPLIRKRHEALCNMQDIPPIHRDVWNYIGYTHVRKGASYNEACYRKRELIRFYCHHWSKQMHDWVMGIDKADLAGRLRIADWPDPSRAKTLWTEDVRRFLAKREGVLHAEVLEDPDPEEYR